MIRKFKKSFRLSLLLLAFIHLEVILSGIVTLGEIVILSSAKDLYAAPVGEGEREIVRRIFDGLIRESERESSQIFGRIGLSWESRIGRIQTLLAREEFSSAAPLATRLRDIFSTPQTLRTYWMENFGSLTPGQDRFLLSFRLAEPEVLSDLELRDLELARSTLADLVRNWGIVHEGPLLRLTPPPDFDVNNYDLFFRTFFIRHPDINTVIISFRPSSLIADLGRMEARNVVRREFESSPISDLFSRLGFCTWELRRRIGRVEWNMTLRTSGTRSAGVIHYPSDLPISSRHLDGGERLPLTSVEQAALAQRLRGQISDRLFNLEQIHPTSPTRRRFIDQELQASRKILAQLENPETNFDLRAIGFREGFRQANGSPHLALLLYQGESPLSGRLGMRMGRTFYLTQTLPGVWFREILTRPRIWAGTIAGGVTITVMAFNVVVPATRVVCGDFFTRLSYVFVNRLFDIVGVTPFTTEHMDPSQLEEAHSLELLCPVCHPPQNPEEELERHRLINNFNELSSTFKAIYTSFNSDLEDNQIAGRANYISFIKDLIQFKMQITVSTILREMYLRELGIERTEEEKRKLLADIIETTLSNSYITEFAFVYAAIFPKLSPVVHQFMYHLNFIHLLHRNYEEIKGRYFRIAEFLRRSHEEEQTILQEAETLGLQVRPLVSVPLPTGEESLFEIQFPEQQRYEQLLENLNDSDERKHALRQRIERLQQREEQFFQEMLMGSEISMQDTREWQAELLESLEARLRSGTTPSLETLERKLDQLAETQESRGSHQEIMGLLGQLEQDLDTVGEQLLAEPERWEPVFQNYLNNLLSRMESSHTEITSNQHTLLEEIRSLRHQLQDQRVVEQEMLERIRRIEENQD